MTPVDREPRFRSDAPDVRVLTLAPEDWRLWRAVRQRSLREEPEAFAASAHQWLGPWDEEALWRRRLAAVRSVVALRGDEPVGTAGLDLAKGELVGMWVATEHRHTGIGRRLVEKILDDAVSAGVDESVVLRVMAENSAAVAFYERCGFVLTSAPVDDEGCVSMVRSAAG